MADITVLVQSPGSEYWGQSTWSSNDWGGSGTPLTSSGGSVTVAANANVTISGISLTSSQGSIISGTSALANVTGQSLTSSIGEEVIDIGVPVTGIAASTSIGATTVDDTTLAGKISAELRPELCRYLLDQKLLLLM